MFTASLLVCFLCVTFVFTAESELFCRSTEVPDYYWREYTGKVPYDALPGGRDKAGRPTYIGQAMVPGVGNIPASIYHGNSSVVASSAKTFYINNNVKILCTGSPDKFKWIPTDTDQMHLITNCNVILGGLDYEDVVQIARVNYEGEVKIGKVIKKHRGILIPDKGGETILPKFELLVYNCSPGNSYCP